MAFTERDGLYFLDGLNSNYIVVESSKKTRYVSYINEKKISSVYLTEGLYVDNDIDFLEECPMVSNLNISSPQITNYNGLYKLSRLSVLLMDTPKAKVDLSVFNELRRLYIELNKNVFGLEKCINLLALHLWKYMPKSQDLSELSPLTNLEELQLTQTPITTLTGLGYLKALTTLKINYCSKLESIIAAKDISNSLKELYIESCKKITDYDDLIELNSLEKLSLVNCAEIRSINFIKKLPNLTSFVFMGTTVLDGDLSACDALDYVAFNEKKHYSRSMKDFSNR